MGIAHPTMAPLGAMQWIKATRCGSALNRIHCRNKQTSLDGKCGSKWQCLASFCATFIGLECGYSIDTTYY